MKTLALNLLLGTLTILVIVGIIALSNQLWTLTNPPQTAQLTQNQIQTLKDLDRMMQTKIQQAQAQAQTRANQNQLHRIPDLPIVPPLNLSSKQIQEQILSHRDKQTIVILHNKKKYHQQQIQKAERQIKQIQTRQML